MKTFRLYVWLLCGLMLCGPVVGCQQLKLLRSQSPDKAEDEDVDDGKKGEKGKDKDPDKEFETKVEIPFVGDYTAFAGTNWVVLEGVGLVVGLDGTGGDPPPSIYREALVNDMRKRDIKDPESILRSPNTALVKIRAYLPPLVRKGEAFDVESVMVVEGDKTTSLNGGWLLETELYEAAVVQGHGVMKGHVMAKAKGPILVTTGEGKSEATGVKLRGKILGGAIAKKERDLRVQLRSNFRSVRQSRLIASKIGDRFFAYNESGLREPLAKALTDQTIELKVLARYKDNYPRYLQVIRNIAFRETAVGRHVRMEKLKTQLLDPDTTEQAALQLEAIGDQAVSILKTGLKHPDQEVRFNSAMALTYLGKSDGITTLGECAVQERAFRVYALAALATLDEAETHLLLRDLMSAQKDESGKIIDSAEMRYGAFRALWTLDKRDPYLNGEILKDSSDRELFGLHMLPTTGESIIHLTHHWRSEIVLFGTNQKFKTPLAVRAGPRIWVTAQPGKDQIVVARYEAGQPDRRKEISTNVAEVIRAVVEFGGSYPDVAQMILQASKQQNLSGRIEIDALPQGGREYVRKPTSAGDTEGKTLRFGNPNLIPNFVPNLKDDEAAKNKQSQSEALESSDKKPNSDKPDSEDNLTDADPKGNASLADARKEPSAPSQDRHWYEFWKRK